MEVLTMRSLVFIPLMLLGHLAMAGTGNGSISCNSRDGSLVALYSWFHSQAESYSNLILFIRESGEKYTQYNASDDRALKAILVHTHSGLVIVTPDLKRDRCTIIIK
jgi:hypothetical protein